MPFPVADDLGVEDEQVLAGSGAAILALKAYEPQTEGERVLVEAVLALSRTVVRVDRRIAQRFLDLREHVDQVAEECRNAVAVATKAQSRITASTDALQELTDVVRGLDAYMRGSPPDRPSSPETPASKSKQVSAPPVDEDPGDQGEGHER